MSDYDQAELDAYLQDIASRMEIYLTEDGALLRASDNKTVLPNKPSFVSDQIDTDIYNIICEIDPCPKTVENFQRIFRSGLTYDELARELDNDDNWID